MSQAQTPFEMFDQVRVIRLTLVDRPAITGPGEAVRHPQVGDTGTVIETPETQTVPTYLVESVDDKEWTRWLADFAAEELELISRLPPKRGS